MESPSRVELPAGFEDVDVDILAVLIADMLERLLAHNDRIPLSPEGLTRFHSRTPPSITIIDYLRRIVKFTNVERTCLLITLHYIDQICARMPLFMLSSLTCHRFVITSIAISSKALCDVICSNTIYAKVGGIPIAELNMLEREFLHMIDWRLTTTREVLQEYYVNLVRTHSKNMYYIADTASFTTTDSEMEDDTTTERSRSASPSPSPLLTTSTPATEAAAMPMVGTSGHNHPRDFAPYEASTILIDTTTLSPEPPCPPTVEQNMAFAAFQQQSGS